MLMDNFVHTTLHPGKNYVQMVSSSNGLMDQMASSSNGSMVQMAQQIMASMGDTRLDLLSLGDFLQTMLSWCVL